MRKKIQRAVFSSVICIIILIIGNGFDVQAIEKNEDLYTAEEISYIQESGIITIGNLPQRAPLSKYDEMNNSFEGINEDILKEISDVSGLKFEFKAVSVGVKPIEELKEGKFNLVAGVVRTDKFLSDSEIILSDSFLTSNVVPIVKEGHKYNPSQNLNIAIPSSFEALDDYIKVNYPNFTITYY